MKRYAFFLLPLLVAMSGDARDKVAAFRSFLPRDAYQELTARSMKKIEQAAKAGDAAAIETEAIILAGYALSDGTGIADAVRLQGAAYRAVEAAQKKDFKPLTDFRKFSSAGTGDVPVKFKATDLNELMYLFRGKAKKGEGIHPDLQYQAKLQNLNGIEALIGALAKKKLTDEQLAKVAKELPLLGYRVAVIGVVTHATPPDKDAARWRELSVQMRDSAIGVAQSAQKKDTEGILKSAMALETSCTACHMQFKK